MALIIANYICTPLTYLCKYPLCVYLPYFLHIPRLVHRDLQWFLYFYNLSQPPYYFKTTLVTTHLIILLQVRFSVLLNILFLIRTPAV